VPQTPQKTRDAVDKLPNPELNPLLNPTLGNNLGRWAQAYFTNPPEKREEAVLELLQELREEAGPDEPVPAGPDAAPQWLQSMEQAQVNSTLNCAECGHQNGPQQRFCGMCGSPLTFSDQLVEPPIQASDPSAQNVATDVASREAIPAAPVSAGELETLPTFGTLSLFATAQPSALESKAKRSETYLASDIQWLREKSYGSDSDTEPGRSSRKYLVTAVGMLLLAVLLYFQWRPTTVHQAKPWPTATPAQSATKEPAVESAKPPTTQSQSAATQPATPMPPENASSGGTKPAAQESVPAGATTPEEQAIVGRNESTQAKTTASKQTDSNPVRTASTVQTEIPASSAGSAELAAAEAYLTGKNGVRNSTEAAILLWKAVGKENPTAIVLLSDLYLAGDGVPKSCTQAQLLLRAAARKGVTAAASKLRELHQTGCP
jgi:TPR repeat protein